MVMWYNVLCIASLGGGPSMPRKKTRRFFLLVLVIAVSIVLGGSFGVLTAYFRTTPDLTDVQIHQNFTTHIYDIEGRLVTDLYREHRVPVSIRDVPPHVRQAVVAIEDDRFYDHHGVNFYAFGRAIIVNLREQRFAQGGGTITMQLARIPYARKNNCSKTRGVPVGMADRT